MAPTRTWCPCAACPAGATVADQQVVDPSLRTPRTAHRPAAAVALGMEGGWVELGNTSGTPRPGVRLGVVWLCDCGCGEEDGSAALQLDRAELQALRDAITAELARGSL